ncbi:hypothetical protein FRC03_006554 [Tulasnella sp. 419]|nr:hypothetical protein FRC03_006554 [Tulasnella sp. 419]
MNDSVIHKENMQYYFGENEEEEDDDHTPDYQKLNGAVALRLSSVCSHWYHGAMTQPQIWSYLDTRYSQEATKLHLERSKGSPLFIICPAGVDWFHESKFMRLIIPHLDRWRAFNSYSENRGLLINHLPKGDYSLPSLESFMIHTTHADAQLKLPVNIYERAPCLREFYLDNRSFPFLMGSEVLSGLTSLGVRCSFKDRAFTMRDYELLFASCPRLQTMVISCADDCLAEFSMFSVKVPNLKSLYLYDIRPRLVTTLLFSLFPNPSKLPLVKIIGSCDPDVSEQAFMDTSRLGSIMDLACRNMAGLSTSALAEDYHDGGGGLIQIWKESEGKLSTVLEFAEYSDCLGEIAVSLFSPNRTSMLRELSLTTADDVAHNLAPYIHCFPHLEHLTITIIRQWNWLEKVINLITQFVFPDGGTEPATSGPQLKRLTLKGVGHDVLNHMPGLFKARHESTQTLLMDSRLLRRLEKFDVQSPHYRMTGLDKEQEIEMLFAARGITFEICGVEID